MDLTALDHQWREASASIWPLSTLGRRKVANMLQGYADGGTVEPDQDLPLLLRMREQLAAIDHTPLKDRQLPVAGLDTDPKALRAILEGAGALRAALRTDGWGPGKRRSSPGVSPPPCKNATAATASGRAAPDYLPHGRVSTRRAHASPRPRDGTSRWVRPGGAVGSGGKPGGLGRCTPLAAGLVGLVPHPQPSGGLRTGRVGRADRGRRRSRRSGTRRFPPWLCPMVAADGARQRAGAA